MKFLKKMIIIFTILIAAIAIGTYLFMQGKQFGELPSGKRLERILKSPHYKNGKFQNGNVENYVLIMSLAIGLILIVNFLLQ